MQLSAIVTAVRYIKSQRGACSTTQKVVNSWQRRDRFCILLLVNLAGVTPERSAEELGYTSEPGKH